MPLLLIPYLFLKSSDFAVLVFSNSAHFSRSETGYGGDGVFGFCGFAAILDSSTAWDETFVKLEHGLVATYFVRKSLCSNHSRMAEEPIIIDDNMSESSDEFPAEEDTDLPGVSSDPKKNARGT